MKLPKKMGEYIRTSSKKNSCFVGGHGERYFFCNCKLVFFLFFSQQKRAVLKKIVSYFWVTIKSKDHSTFLNNPPGKKKNSIQ